MKQPVKIISKKKARAVVRDLDNLLGEREMSFFLTALQEEEDSEISSFFAAIIKLEEICNTNIS